jgi:nucleoid-associated protein EbfC
MKNLMGLMGQIKEMQEKMTAMQEDLQAIECTGSAAGGLVNVTLSGKGDLRGVSIDPSLLKPDEGEILEDLLVAAHRDAREKVEATVAQKTSELTAGLPLPPGMKLPF